MYRTIQMTFPEEKKVTSPLFTLDPFAESVVEELIHPFTEAVFSGGKKKVEPIIGKVQAVKDELERQIKEQEEDEKGSEGTKNAKIRYFNPNIYWRQNVWKELEDSIQEVFGFRTVNIEPFIERYNSKEKLFESKMLNAFVYTNSTRYPVEALVTDDGLYDKTHSLYLNMRVSLGLIRELSAEEITAVMLHEIGHGVDPALVDIRYTSTNILSKYITDRRNCINKPEQKAIDKSKDEKNSFVIILIFLLANAIPALFSKLQELFIGKKKMEKKRLEKIRKAISREKSQFRRQEYSEAFADNFARMYGMAAPLMSGLRKIDVDSENRRNSRIKSEAKRQEYILDITLYLLKDEHKTDIHRIRALIREYEADIKDPNTPDAVKKQMQDDLTELEKVLDEYLNNFSEFQNRVNQILNEELKKMDDEKAKEAEKNAPKPTEDHSGKKEETDKKNDTK